MELIRVDAIEGKCEHDEWNKLIWEIKINGKTYKYPQHATVEAIAQFPEQIIQNVLDMIEKSKK